jgi:molybdopterin biosynthesis enzyme
VRVTLERADGSRDGSRVARVCQDQSSGVLLSMVRADALVFVPEEVTEIEAGSEVPAILIGSSDLCAEPGH